ncbi:MAG: peptide deformylase [Nitrospirota bacterium]|nr:MAG: peptide deformylase [Nitrospirota bacterium]
MSVCKIYTYPDEILRGNAANIEEINGDTQVLIDNMVETMYAAPGIGLAAPQIGDHRRVIVLDVSNIEEHRPLITIINPVIVEAQGTVESEEGCLSVPGYISSIRRHEKVLVKGVDRDGKEIFVEADGLLSRALQHEIDHLDGVLFVDKMSKIKREFFKKRYLRSIKA